MPIWHISICYLCIYTCHIVAIISICNWYCSLLIIWKNGSGSPVHFWGGLVLQNLIDLDLTIPYSGSNHHITSWYTWQSVCIGRFPQRPHYLILAFQRELLEILCRCDGWLISLALKFFWYKIIVASGSLWVGNIDTWIPNVCQKCILFFSIVSFSLKSNYRKSYLSRLCN